jgi:hypothetical protein
MISYGYYVPTSLRIYELALGSTSNKCTKELISSFSNSGVPDSLSFQGFCAEKVGLEDFSLFMEFSI